MKVAAVVPAAGRGERMSRALDPAGGPGAPGGKLFMTLGGRPVLQWTLEGLLASPAVEGVWLAAPPGQEERVRAALSRFGLARQVQVIPGGASRQESVRRLVEALPESVEWVVVHDGARPLVDGSLVDRVLAAALREGAAICALPAHETVKRVGSDGLVERTLDRSGLWAVQTPQVFRRTLLAEAHRRAAGEDVPATDDASLVEWMGHPVRVIPGSRQNIKVTTPEDLALAEAWIRVQGGGMYGRPWQVPDRAMIRTGMGVDVHALAAGRPLILGGVTIPWEMGLVGHSDGDALTHAVADAILGAAGLGDLGGWFPDDDPAYEGADSLRLLHQVAEAVREAGLRVLAVDATVVAQVPRLAPYLGAMARNLRRALGDEELAVNVKATRPEGLGALGRSEGIAALSVVTLAGR